MAYGTVVNLVAPDLTSADWIGNLGVETFVPDPSLERLNTIAELCVRDSTRPDAAVPLSHQPVTEAALPDFIAQVEALPADAIPPACRADLLAVAEAVQRR